MGKAPIASLLSALFLACIWLPLSAHAESVRIQPAIIEERIDPGGVHSTVLRVTNLDAESRVFYLFTKDVASVDSTGKPTFTDEAEPLYGMRSWITLPGDTLTVPAGETREIPILIKAPEGAVPGGHFGGIFVSLRAVRPSETGVGVGYEVGTIVSMRVAGEAIEEARIREFSTEKTVYETPEAPFSIRVENLGNVLVRPRGPIQVVDMFGRQMPPIIVNEEAAGIYPKTERTFSAGWSSNELLALGRYQATVSLVYGEDERDTVTAALSFWVLPVKAIAGILAGLIALIAIFVFGIRWYIRKKIHELGSGGSVARPDALMPPSRLLAATIAAILFALLLLFLVFVFFGS